jgi:hypothetical protein
VDTDGQANLGTVTSANIDRIYTLRNTANLLLSVAPSSIEEIEKRVPVIINWLQSIGKEVKSYLFGGDYDDDDDDDNTDDAKCDSLIIMVIFVVKVVMII